MSKSPLVSHNNWMEVGLEGWVNKISDFNTVVRQISADRSIRSENISGGHGRMTFLSFNLEDLLVFNEVA